VKAEQFIITFPVGGPLADRFCTIVAADETAARMAVIGVYGQAGWAGIYPDDHAMSMIERHGLSEVPFGTDYAIAQDYAW
jgi:hypothetical protein